MWTKNVQFLNSLGPAELRSSARHLTRCGVRNDMMADEEGESLNNKSQPILP